MFSNYNDNINSNDLLSAVKIPFDNAAVVALAAVEEASNATIQFYTDDVGIAAIGAANLGSTPIVKISESAVRAGDPGTMPAGLQLAYMGVYEVRGIKNLKNIQFVGLFAGVTCYADVSYYK